MVLPEGDDERVLFAAKMLAEEEIARVILLGNLDRMSTWFEKNGGCPEGVELIDPLHSARLDEFAEQFYQLRKHKGCTLQESREKLKKVSSFGMMLLRSGAADGLVSGAAHSTADTVRPALQIIGTAKGNSIASSFFVMVIGGKPYIFSDCGLIEDPSARQLSTIALQSAFSAIQFDIPPKVALLSYSTHGSAQSAMTEKVRTATAEVKEILRRDYSNLPIVVDGELQLDAAVVPEVAAQKAPDSNLQGEARVLVFPDLNAGNIGYKLMQRLGGAEAYGPILQGLNSPVNDLSRGCSPEDIVGVTAITALTALNSSD